MCLYVKQETHVGDQVMDKNSLNVKTSIGSPRDTKNFSTDMEVIFILKFMNTSSVVYIVLQDMN